MSDFAIRKAVRGDEGEILRLILELAQYEHLASQVQADEETLADELFEKHNAHVLLACLDGRPIGYALYFINFSTFLGRSGIYLEDLFIMPEHRGHGYGKALLRTLARDCIDNGRGRLEWACLDWNAPSIAFYRALGAVSMDGWTTYRLTGDTLRHMAE